MDKSDITPILAPHMKRFSLAALFVFLSCNCAAATSCEEMDAVPVQLKITSASFSSVYGYIGSFAFFNYGNRDIKVDFIVVDDRRYLLDSKISFQFPDVNHRWVTWITGLPSTVGKVKTASVKSGSTETFYAQLPPAELLAEYNSIRATVDLTKPHLCIASIPFYPVFEEGKIKAVKSSRD